MGWFSPSWICRYPLYLIFIHMLRIKTPDSQIFCLSFLVYLNPSQILWAGIPAVSTIQYPFTKMKFTAGLKEQFLISVGHSIFISHVAVFGLHKFLLTPEHSWCIPIYPDCTKLPNCTIARQIENPVSHTPTPSCSRRAAGRGGNGCGSKEEQEDT